MHFFGGVSTRKWILFDISYAMEITTKKCAVTYMNYRIDNEKKSVFALSTNTCTRDLSVNQVVADFRFRLKHYF